MLGFVGFVCPKAAKLSRLLYQSMTVDIVVYEIKISCCGLG